MISAARWAGLSDTYRQHLFENKERAFKKWRDSGYRDFAAHDQFLAWYEEAQRYHLASKVKA
jgi:hypothetical protein